MHCLGFEGRRNFPSLSRVCWEKKIYLFLKEKRNNKIFVKSPFAQYVSYMTMQREYNFFWSDYLVDHFNPQWNVFTLCKCDSFSAARLLTSIFEKIAAVSTCSNFCSSDLYNENWVCLWYYHYIHYYLSCTHNKINR